MLNKITAIFAPLKKDVPTATELRAALEAINVPAAEAEVDALESERRKLLLAENADKQLDEIEGRIKAANRTVEKLIAGREELQASLTLAEARELAFEVAQRGARASELRDELRTLYLLIDSTASSLAKQLGDLQAKRAELRSCNNFTASHGELRLKGGDPLGELAISMGRPIDSIADFAAWRLPPYWPAQPGASPLARLADSPLTAPAARKAA